MSSEDNPFSHAPWTLSQDATDADAQAIVGAQDGLLAVDYHLKGGTQKLVW